MAGEDVAIAVEVLRPQAVGELDVLVPRSELEDAAAERLFGRRWRQYGEPAACAAGAGRGDTLLPACRPPRHVPRHRGGRTFKSFRQPTRSVHTLKERVLHPFAGRERRASRRCRTSRSRSSDGEFFGIVGRNGSGKSTLLKCLAGIYGVDPGEISVDGRLATFIELGVGFNPDLAAHDNVVLNGIMLGLTRAEAEGALRADHRVRRARGVPGPQAQELLVGHARPARVLRGDPGRRRHPPDRRGARRRRRRLPAEVLRRVPPACATRARRSSSSRTTCSPSTGSATARCCSSAASRWCSTRPSASPTATSS